MIRNFADAETERLFSLKRSRKLPSEIQNVARRKLFELEAADYLDDMRSPPGNRLEQLKRTSPLRYSVRINDQWRLTFGWSDGGATDVRVEDYHR